MDIQLRPPAFRRMFRFAPYIILIGCSAVFSDQINPEQAEFFEKKVRPVLMGTCFKCHGGEKTNHGLRLDHLTHILKGGDSGPAIIPGDPEKSLLIQAIRRTHKDLKMPPKKPLDDRVVADLVQWIKIGAPWPETPNSPIEKPKTPPVIDHWSFKPLTHPTPPQSKDDAWSKTPIDQFILASLKANNLTPNAPANKRTLIRRATFDLIGLPPTPNEIDGFLADDSPEAFGKVVERLLASKHYGERWGRHWLDLVRYADTAGDNSDFPVPQLYRYRNYVIDSFNQDKPYNLFVQEQIAGDLMDYGDENEKHQRIIATGYIALSRRFGSQINNYPQHLTIEDTIDNLGKSFLGLTISCARCHDHKFDPVSMQDYYGLYGFFSSTRYPFPGIELEKAPRDLVPLIPQDEYEAIMKPYREKLAVHDKDIKSIESDKKDAETKFQQINKDIKKQQTKKPDDAEAKASANAHLEELEQQKEVAQDLIDDLRRIIKSAKKRRDYIAKDAPHVELAYAVAEAEPANARLHLRGEPKNLGKEVPRRFLDQLGGQKLPDEVTDSGRLHLARWLTDPENPLTARVMVNRIWQYHFGKAFVQTANNFGSKGKKPTHPQLLDFLAARFIDSKWSIKAMHRLIMSSQTYQLSPADTAPNNKIDPENLYYWKFDRRRLDAEAIRDAMLAVSGQLDTSPAAEPHPFPPQKSWRFSQHKPFKAVYETNKRSVYLMTQRIKKHPFMAIFDGPDTNAATPNRASSITPIQALFMMNDPFVHTQAEKFAHRLMQETPHEDRRIELAFILALARPPTDQEHRASKKFLQNFKDKRNTNDTPANKLEQLAWESYARTLLRTNEFIYFD